jgi:GNAT superfamily N-acetyltransferase
MKIERLHAPTSSDLMQLAEVLVDCVTGGASVSFMLPLSIERAMVFWQGIDESLHRGERALLVARSAEGEIVGTVQVIVHQPENQPHRADVAKMLVHRRARRSGVAAALLAEAEHVARMEGKTMLVLDTVTGGAAERLYQRGGWQRCGVIPNYALMPDGEPCATTVFYKAV